jgi:hypothetical protein
MYPMNDTNHAASEPTCFECNLPRSSHTNDGPIYLASRRVSGGTPTLYCTGFAFRPLVRPTDVSANMPLDACLESVDPFSGSGAQAHYMRVRRVRGW